MIDDIRPVPGPGKSLRAALDELPNTKSPESKAETETFKTPDEVAAAQTLESESSPENGDEHKETKGEQSTMPQETFDASKKTEPSKPGWRNKLKLSWPPSKKEYLVLAATVVVLGGGGFLTWHLLHHSKPPLVIVKSAPLKKVATPTSNLVPSTLSGLPVDPSINKLPVTGVMVENSDFARPQSGLGSAGVVFEAIAEGGITRFLALFQDTSPSNVGPIRSARPYYEQWALGFDAGYAHVGGSPEALSDITAWNVRDLNEFYNGSYYHRISSRAAPHNMYTGIPTLQQLETKKGYTSSHYTGFARKADTKVKVSTASTIKFTLSGPDYNVAYTYDNINNNYKRSEGGAPMIDANTGTQITPKVVIAMVMSYSLEPDHYHSSYNVLGSGPAYIFQDGAVTIGQWTKSSNASQILFTDSNNTPIKLNAGTTWITAVAGKNDVNYSP